MLQQTYVVAEWSARANNLTVQQRNRSGTVSFLLDSSSNEMEDADVDGFLSDKEIVSNKMQKYQSGKETSRQHAKSSSYVCTICSR